MVKIKRIRKINKNVEERQVLINMIINSKLFQQIRPICSLDYFKTPFAKTIASWCLSYWDQYKESPGRHIEDLFNKKEEKGDIDGDQLDLIRQFLEGLSEEYETASEKSTEYLATQTELYFQKRALELHKEQLSLSLSDSDLESAQFEVQDFKFPTREKGIYSDPWTNEKAIIESFESEAKPLFSLKNALGNAWDNQLVRGSMIGVLAPEKRGKTWIMMSMARSAIVSGNKVAFFSVGDMTEPQMRRRFHIMEAKKSDKPKYCQKILIPIIDCMNNQEGTCQREELRTGTGRLPVPEGGEEERKVIFDEDLCWVPCSSCNKDPANQTFFVGTNWWIVRNKIEPVSWQRAVKQGIQFDKKYGSEANFRLSCHPNSSINIKGISAILTNWQTVDGFVPDILIIDYADILAPEDNRVEFRHKQNDTWKAMRALSQELNCLLITATQADAKAYGIKTLREENFSEDKRKYAHVTGIMTLNQLPEEKKQGIMRIGQMFLREDEYDANRTVTVLQSLASGQPILDSFYTPQIKA